MTFTGNKGLCQDETFQRSLNSHELHEESLILVTTVSLLVLTICGDAMHGADFRHRELIECRWLMFEMFLFSLLHFFVSST
jgi:hypothetical protein